MSCLNIRSRTYHPRGLLLQWHVTERCNLRCSHCYQEAYAGKELGYQELLDVLQQYLDLLRAWRRRAKEPVRGHVTVTGGEPFARQDFLELLDVFATHKDDFGFAILTNGSFIDTTMANRLHGLGPRFVQVSIEGTESTHDAIRGRGNFRRTVEAVKCLVRARIRTMISFTAHRGNFREFPGVARLGRKLRVARVWADRLIPCGSGSALREQVLTPAETREFVEIMCRARTRPKGFRFLDPTEIAMHRALQFLAGGRAYQCTAGDSLITVEPNGDLLPCRRMPIPVGNLMEKPLAELYYASDLFQSLRDRSRIGDGCRECSFAELCRGGLKCLSYALTGDPFRTDPGCWLASGEARTACPPPVEAAR